MITPSKFFGDVYDHGSLSGLEVEILTTKWRYHRFSAEVGFAGFVLGNPQNYPPLLPGGPCFIFENRGTVGADVVHWAEYAGPYSKTIGTVHPGYVAMVFLDENNNYHMMSVLGGAGDTTTTTTTTPTTTTTTTTTTTSTSSSDGCTIGGGTPASWGRIARYRRTALEETL